MLRMAGLALCLGLVSWATGLNAQPAGSAADKLDQWRRALEEYKTAETAKQGRVGVGDNIQTELNGLSEKKAALGREMEYAKAKLDNAQKQHQVSVRLAAQDEIEKWKREMDAWQSRVSAAEAEIAKIDSDTASAILRLQQRLDESSKGVMLPGEVLQLFVLEDESFNGLYQIREGGYVVLPRVGRVAVVGKDMGGVERAVKEALEATQLRQATVMVERARGVYAETKTDVVYLAGEFQTPGPMKIPEGFSPTIVTVILRSGGLTPVADLTRVKLLRLEHGRALVEEVNVQAILDGTGLQSDLALNAGDIVVVPAFSPIVYVTGNVQSPRILQLTPDEELTAYSAILRCGGFARFANLSKVYVMRDLGAGEKKKIPVNIKDVQKGKTSDIVLQGLDIVVIPESWFSW